MDLTPKQQAVAAIKAASKILIVSHERPDGDAVGAVLALKHIFSKISKEVTSVSVGPVSEKLRFLQGWQLINSRIEGVKDFIISVSEEHGKVDKLAYKLENNKLRVVVSPKSGNILPSDVNFSYGDFHFDLIIILDADALERLGEIYQKNTEMFYRGETLNIDHHASNTYFGKINWVVEESSSTCEILVSLIEALESEHGRLMDKEIATALLTGIMTDTNLFQAPNTTPKSLTIAAQLIAAGGDRDIISKKVFQTNTYSTLKIWGRILSKLDSYPALGIVWSEVSTKDFNETGADDAALSSALNNLLYSTEGAKVIILFKERNGLIEISLRSIGDIDVSMVAKEFGGGGHAKAAGFKLEGSTLEDAKKIVLDKMRQIISGPTIAGSKGSQSSIQEKTEN